MMVLLLYHDGFWVLRGVGLSEVFIFLFHIVVGRLLGALYGIGCGNLAITWEIAELGNFAEWQMCTAKKHAAII